MRRKGERGVGLLEGVLAGEDQGVVVCEGVTEPFVQLRFECVGGVVDECVFRLLDGRRRRRRVSEC